MYSVLPWKSRPYESWSPSEGSLAQAATKTGAGTGPAFAPATAAVARKLGGFPPSPGYPRDAVRDLHNPAEIFVVNIGPGGFAGLDARLSPVFSGAPLVLFHGCPLNRIFHILPHMKDRRQRQARPIGEIFSTASAQFRGSNQESLDLSESRT